MHQGKSTRFKRNVTNFGTVSKQNKNQIIVLNPDTTFKPEKFAYINPLNANPEKRSNTLKQIVGNLPTICLSVFDHFMNLALKGLIFYVKLIRF